MTLSRRSFFSGLAVALAAPAIVKAEGLMRLAPTEILRPGISLRLITDYNPLEVPVNRLDVLYGSMHVRREWEYVAADLPPQLTLNEFQSRILAPMIEKMQEHVADVIMHGQGASRYDLHGMKSIRLQDLLLEARSTPSFE